MVTDSQGVNPIVNLAVRNSLGWIPGGVYLSFYKAVESSLRGGLWESVARTTSRAVFAAIYEPEHPALTEFLIGVEAR